MVVGAILLGACGGMFAPPAPPRQLEIKNTALPFSMPNGVRGLLFREQGVDRVALGVRYEVGSLEDPQGKEGLAHLVEHLMFEKRLGPTAIGAELRRLAVGMNAYTTWDSTHYMTLAPREHLDEVIKLEALRLNLGCNTIPQEIFEREREVVRNEIRQRTQTPGGQIQSYLHQAAYPEGHPYRRLPGGSDLPLASITLDDVCDFMKAYYVPQRLNVVIVGDVEPRDLEQVMLRRLGAIPARQVAPRAWAKVPPVPAPSKPVRIVHRLDIDQPIAFAVWPMPPRFARDEAAADMVTGMVAGRLSGFAGTYEFATSVSLSRLGGAHAPMAAIGAVVRDADDVDEAESALRKSAGRVHRYIGENGFESLQRDYVTSYLSEFESLLARSIRFADYIQFDPEGEFFIGEIKRIDQLEVQDVRRTAEQRMDPDRAITVIFLPDPDVAVGRDARAALTFGGLGHDHRRLIAENPEDARRPHPLPDLSRARDRARSVTLDNGLEVVLQPSGMVPLIDIRLVFGSGAAHASDARAGLARLAADLLQTTARDWQAGYGMSLSGGLLYNEVDDDHTTFRIRGPAMHLDLLIKGLERLVKGGTYNQRTVERYRDRAKVGMAQRTARLDRVFARALAQGLYGAAHPYATRGLPTADTLDRINVDELNDFKATHYVARNATLVIAGQFDAELAEQHVRFQFSHWPAGRAQPPVSTPLGVAPAAQAVVDEDRATTAVYIGYATAAGVDEHYGARLVLGAMLSAAVSSAREHLGSSYGLYASYEAGTGPGRYLVAGEIDPQRTGETLAALRDSIAALREPHPGLDELFVAARREVVNGLLFDSTHSSVVSEKLAFLAVHDLPRDYFITLAERVAALTPDDLRARIAQDLRPGSDVILLRGPRAAIDQAARATGITFVDPPALD